MITTDNQQGFTIIEVMIAITVFAIGILALNIMQTSSIKGNSASNRLSGRTSWATDQIEQIVGWNYTDPRLTDDGNATSVDGTANSPNNIYSITWSVTNNTPITDTKTITITTYSLNNDNSTFTYIKAKPL